MISTLPAWIWPIVGLLVGFLIQGPMFWIMGWLAECIKENKWIRLVFEVKYVATWIVSILLTVVAMATTEGKFAELIGGTWWLAVMIGIGGQATIREFAKFLEKRTGP